MLTVWHVAHSPGLAVTSTAKIEARTPPIALPSTVSSTAGSSRIIAIRSSIIGSLRSCGPEPLRPDPVRGEAQLDECVGGVLDEGRRAADEGPRVGPERSDDLGKHLLVDP